MNPAAAGSTMNSAEHDHGTADASSGPLRTMNKLPSESEVLGYASTLSNWGRWGADDELGTINLITPSKRKQAAGLVTDGITVSCAWPISTDPAPDVSRTPIHLMTGTGEGYSLDSDPTEEQGSGDFIGLAYHGYTVTHVDAPSHIFMSGRMYNGLPSTVVNSTQGATAGSIELIADGIVTRCVLLDIARLRGVDWMAPGEAILSRNSNARRPNRTSVSKKATCCWSVPAGSGTGTKWSRDP